MKKIRLLGVLMALLFVSMQSFKKPEISDWVWFRANPATGIITDINEGMRSYTPPGLFSCNVGLFFCAEAFSIAEGDVTLISGSSYYHLNVLNTLSVLQYEMNGLGLRAVP